MPLAGDGWAIQCATALGGYALFVLFAYGLDGFRAVSLDAAIALRSLPASENNAALRPTEVE